MLVRLFRVLAVGLACVVVACGGGTGGGPEGRDGGVNLDTIPDGRLPDTGSVPDSGNFKDAGPNDGSSTPDGNELQDGSSGPDVGNFTDGSEVPDGSALPDVIVDLSVDTWNEILDDKVPPVVELVFPKDGAAVNGKVTIQVEASDGNGIDRVELYLDDQKLEALPSAPYDYEWDTLGLSDGDRTLLARAFDGAGNQAEDQVSVKVNNCDLDGDGFLSEACQGWDCDDTDGLRYPTAPDTVGDGADQNCDGLDGVDADDDGYAAEASGGTDCDDNDPFSFPTAFDTVGDGVDQNCDGLDGVDSDGDGYAAEASGGTDCDDADKHRSPAAVDTVGDMIDQNCDRADGFDADRDGRANLESGGSDCNDADKLTYPTAPDTVGDGKDRNCDGLDGVDADGDGYASSASGGSDCNDADKLAYPAAPDTVGDGVDQNCDGADGVDGDGDGYASKASGGTDCDDTDKFRYPNAPDTVGDGKDQNCDGLDGVDADGDGYASTASGEKDCDDTKPLVHPCTDDLPNDSLDANCDGKLGLSCDDCDACTTDAFSGGACTHTAIPENGTCEDGDACTTGESCKSKVCSGGAYSAVLAGTPCPGGVCFGGGCCIPNCIGKVCGGDGCGGSCGTCGEGKTCGGTGSCVWDIEALGNKWKPIHKGTFQIGCSPGDVDCQSDEKPVHTVTLSAFDMLETEVTEGQYQAVIGSNPSCKYNGATGATMPVECVNWSQAKAFCEAVGGRLPTEAEWEYAARGGTTTRFYCGDNSPCLSGIAWYDSNSGVKKQAVKGKTANALGLFDMLGNVKEWTNDWYGTYGSEAQANPQGPNDGAGRVVRGGCFFHGSDDLRVSHRYGGDLLKAYVNLGFRCSRSIGATTRSCYQMCLDLSALFGMVDPESAEFGVRCKSECGGDWNIEQECEGCFDAFACIKTKTCTDTQTQAFGVCLGQYINAGLQCVSVIMESRQQ